MAAMKKVQYDSDEDEMPPRSPGFKADVNNMNQNLPAWVFWLSQAAWFDKIINFSCYNNSNIRIFK